MRIVAWLALALAAIPLAAGGSADAPELVDPEGDHALPHGAAYLDIVAVWIEAETADDFVVAMRLASFDERLAEGAGYAAQFRHQGEAWGIVATYRPVSDAGWAFFTGVLTPDDARTETFRPSAGSFDAESATLRVPFPKSIFPHRDAADRELRDFYAGSSDLRTAYPFFLVGDQVDPNSSDGKWLLCDEGSSEATYTFQVGAHSEGHDTHVEEAAEERAAMPPGDRAAGTIEADAPRETPLAPWATLAALVAAVLGRRRGGRGPRAGSA